MTEKGNWKIILKYTLGLVILAVAAALAIFMPEWYSEWQDERQMDQVVFAKRESIQFLDGDFLDITERLKVLQEVDESDTNVYWMPMDYYSWVQGELLSEEDIIGRCRELVQKWIEADGLLPEACGRWLNLDSSASIDLLVPYAIYIEQNVLPVYVLRMVSPEGTGRLTIVMDAELDMLYYVSVTGKDAMEDMAEFLGYDSLQEVQERIMAGEKLEQGRQADPRVANADFAGVCGADNAEVSGVHKTWIELDITLYFDNMDFEGHAFRRIVRTENGPGYALMYGTENWLSFIMEETAIYGWEEIELTGEYLEDYFLELMDSYGTDAVSESYGKTQIIE